MLATESNLVRLKQEGGFIQKEVRWPTDSLGRMGKAGTETKRPATAGHRQTILKKPVQ